MNIEKSPIRVLIIEDNPGDARLIERLVIGLDANAFEFVHAANLETGLNHLEEGVIEALLLDLSLPDSQGLATFTEAHSKAPSVPVIILTGTIDDELALRAVREGAQDYIVKGEVDARFLVRALQYAIERSRRERVLEGVSQVSAALRKADSRSEIISAVVAALGEALHLDATALIAFDSEHETFLVESAVGQWFAAKGTTISLPLNVRESLMEDQVLQMSKDRSAADLLTTQLGLQGNVASVALSPLVAQDEMIGTLAIGRERPLAEYDLEVLRAVGNIATNAIQRATLLEKTVLQLKRMESLRAIDLSIATNRNIPAMFNTIIDYAVDLLGIDAVAILRVDGSGGFYPAASRGFASRWIYETKIRIDDSIFGRAFVESKTILVSDYQTVNDRYHQELLAHDEDFSSLMVAPLSVKGQAIGVLAAFHQSYLKVDSGSVNFFEILASQAALAIHVADLLEHLEYARVDVESAYDATLEGWVRALDFRDHETEGHSQRVTQMTLDLGRAYGLSESELLDMKRGALLHDIGKIAVPDNILRKPGALTPEEWQIMKLHPGTARDLIQPIDYLRNSLDIPFCHHEKWDGSGYPRGLKGEEIPLAARLFAIVDVYDALTSDRPYRAAWSEVKTLEHIREQIGRHFDPQCVELFLKIFLP